jgi:hypothetical protein
MKQEEKVKRKEIGNKVTELLSVGVSKTEAYAQLAGSDVKENKYIAAVIAYRLDPKLRDQHAKKNYVLVVLMILFCLIEIPKIVLYVTGDITDVAPVIGAAVSILVASLFAWEFSKFSFVAYNVLILILCLNVIHGLKDLKSPETIIALFVIVVVIGYVYFVRSKLFPGLSFLGTVKKDKDGKFIFST